ncbi:hypothetical protein [Coraliomargarita akajimensis]|uniref:Uncharacterized protein n=1 Tax=Coraliomargarita akajimensis (strain DSM 45221 / IAM 15411 / JCM 23193 / KCTC 12865 / 04OKA010-24) TaxID=583355 RepID=D5EPF6_CORAD|nr:hypothetical protein [Coraliomargarita akajimensis]ADE53693.1 hypothetical protein Caka_0668 [Coraliomargarita akajimensis DSM 45221]
MLFSKSLIKVSTIVLLALICFAGSQLTAARKSKIDLSILEQRQALTPYLEAEQIQQVRSADQQIEDAQADIRQGENLLARKPSKLKPNDDVKVYHDQGKDLIKQAEKAIQAAEEQIALALQAALVNREKQAELAKQRYDFSIPTTEYEAALKQGAETVLNGAWDKGYNQIIYSEIFVGNSVPELELSAEQRNQAYDTITAIDGNRFSVSLIEGLTFTDDSFDFENKSSFVQKPTAVLLFELLQAQPNTAPLLVCRAVDLQSHTVIVSALFEVSNLNGEARATTASLSGGIEDGKDLLQVLSKLSTPYVYKLSVGDGSEQYIQGLLFEYSLLKNSGLALIGNNVAAPLGAVDSAGGATAELSFEALEGSQSEYQLVARVLASGRSLTVGRAFISGL